MLALVYTIGDSIAEAVDECIETRFGGVCLPTSIKYLQEVITYSGDMIAVQVYTRLAILLAVGNTGVSISPGLVVSNCLNHLLLNLTHWCRDLFDSVNIAQIGGTCNPLCATSATVTASQLLPMVRLYHRWPQQFLTSRGSNLPPQ